MEDNELQANRRNNNAGRPGPVKVEHVSFMYSGPIIQHTQVCVGNDCYGWAPQGDVGWQGVGLNAPAKFSYETRETGRGAWISDSYTIPNTTRQDVLTALKDLGQDLLNDGIGYSTNNMGNNINCHGFASIAKDQLPQRAQVLTQLRMRGASIGEDGEMVLANTMNNEQLSKLEQEVGQIFAQLKEKGVVMSSDVLNTTIQAAPNVPTMHANNRGMERG
ncbi:MAG: hypothetical protein EAZ74_00445 [Alphaproteobacteria bacterium]|nr:MAG: hypothetical protein EAY76_04420 [Alphaproteobacteria bacterium]TAF16018.1 MAG: hypothetical protein EAZ74_00445 [Alphaproteobacteria bacterium]TAF76209.1 MAG: hypothetical protein EAZ52_04745 [Alphaproteobacteria bacterium]